MAKVGYEETKLSAERRKTFEYIRSQLLLEQSTFLTHWRDLAIYASPRRARFSVIDVNRGDRRNQNIIDPTASLALRTCRSGMMGGITSPARPWFKLETPYPELNKKQNVKEWLSEVTDRMQEIYLKSNLYNVLPIIYGDMAQFATAAMLIEEDFEDCVRFYAFPIGTYTIAMNSKGKIDTFCRDFRMTVKQMVQKWGYDEDDKDQTGDPDWSKFSVGVKNLWENKEREVWIDVCHIIMPNPDHDPKKLHSKYKKFLSVYYERGSTGNTNNSYIGPDDDRLLSEKGYDYFPVLCPRWEVSAEDAYGTSCPGMDSLGDNKQLQIGERRTMQAIEKMVNPPMVAPTSMRNAKTSVLPGDVTYVDVREGQKGFQSVYEIKFDVDAMERKQEQVRQRIKKCYFEDLFLAMIEADKDMTATEVNERHEEKLLALGPVLEQLNQDLLDPNIEITFQIGMEQGKFPPAPPELHGMTLTVEYVSIMHQAQKLAGIGGIDRFAGFIANAAQTMPSILDKVDPDKLADSYADMTSLPVQILRSDDDVAKIRQHQQQIQQQQQQAEQMNQQSQTAKNLSQSDMGGNNALNALIKQSQAGQLEQQ